MSIGDTTNKNKREEISRKRSITTRIITFAIVVILSFGVIISALGYFIYRNSAVNYHAGNAASVADAVASMIDPVQFADSIDGDAPDEYWNYVARQVDVAFSRIDGLAYLYILY